MQSVPGPMCSRRSDEKRSIVLRECADRCADPNAGLFRRESRRCDQPRRSISWPPAVIRRRPSGSGDWRSGQLVAVLRGHTQPVECLAFSRDGKKLASGSFDATVRIWDFPSGAEPRVYRGHSAAIAAIAFHPDGRRLASASMGDRLAGEIQLWDAATGQNPQSLRGHSSLCPSPFVPPRRPSSGVAGR